MSLPIRGEQRNDWFACLMSCLCNADVMCGKGNKERNKIMGCAGGYFLLGRDEGQRVCFFFYFYVLFYLNLNSN